jgi:hypothetical protein
MRELPDRIYTLAIGERAILTFPARSLQEAQSLLKERWLLSDLREVRSKGAPVWDGKEKLVVRNALSHESDRFQRGAKSAAGDDLPIVYLIELY